MKTMNFRRSVLLLFTLLLGFATMVSEADARGGGRSFGGFRSSRPSYAPNRSAAPRSPSRSIFSPRSSSSPSVGTAPKAASVPRSSFGGQRLGSTQEYTRSYGIPRRSEQMAIPSTGGGIAQNYTVHRYGGLGDGFMVGYLTGASSWMWHMPFHPAFYYSRPYYVEGPNGMEVYPPTFSWTRLIIVLLIVGGIGYFVVATIRNRRRGSRNYSRSSFG